MRDIPASNCFLARLIAESLVDAGCRHLIISPGARSAPLAIALARESRIAHIVHFDERGAAYCALGIAKRTEQPVAILCTSGTAVANYFPAVVEASQTAVPLIVLTADRPARLRGSGANQTIMQPNIFGSYARVSVDLRAEIPEQALRASIQHALQSVTRTPHTVAHLNCQFDEPLVEATFSQHTGIDSTRSIELRDSVRVKDKAIIQDILSPLLQLKSSNQTGLTLLGALAPSEQEIAERIADWLGFPVIADIQSGLRVQSLEHLIVPFHASGEWLSRKYESVDALVHLGGELTSRRTLDWLSKLKTGSYLQHREREDAWNPFGHAIRHISQSITHLSPGDLDPLLRFELNEKRLSERRSAVRRVFSEIIPASDLTEAGATVAIWSQLPTARTLILASSMPIRCFDLYADLSSTRVVLSNRGASGIDGTIATAVGVAIAEGKRVTTVVGDLALLHDMNSLALVAQSKVSLTIVVFNNHGGGIFSHLSVRQQSSFEELFLTPHTFKFRSAAEQFGLAYAAPDTIADLLQALELAESKSQSTLIELNLDWQRDVQLHQEIQRHITETERG